MSLLVPAEHPTAFLRALLDASPFGVMALDTAGRVRLWSRGAQNILGWREEDVIGRPLPSEIELLPSSNREVAVRLVKNEGTVIEVEAWTADWREGTVIVVADNSRYRSSEREIRNLMEREQEALAQGFSSLRPPPCRCA